MAQFDTFDLGRVIQTGEGIKGMRRQSTLDALQQQLYGQQIKTGETNAANVAADRAAALGKDKATQVFTTMQYALQSPDPSAFVEQNAPDLIQELSKNGVNWQQLDQPTRLRMLQGIQAKAGAEIGQGPAPIKQPDAYTLKPGEIRFEGSKQVAAVPDNPNATDKGFSLSPGQIRYDANGKPIATAPAAPRSPVDTAKIAGDLRQEYNTQSKTFRDVADSYQRIRDSVSDPSAAGDLALIFNYMKVLDPGSTVREGEFATAQQAGSVPARILAQYNKVLNGERLAPEQRADFFSRATKLYQGQEKRHETSVKKRYESLATRAGVDPSEVTVDINAQTTPVDSTGGSEPTATGPNGQKLVLRNGQWVPL